MADTRAAEQALKDGDAVRALKLLTEQVRAHPQHAKLRVFLFQLLCVLGQWERALNQLNVSLELDAGTLPMVQTYREAIACETLRMQVFAGQKVPVLFGEPETWPSALPAVVGANASACSRRCWAAAGSPRPSRNIASISRATQVSGSPNNTGTFWPAKTCMRRVSQAMASR